MHPEAARAEGQLAHRVEQHRVEQDLAARLGLAAHHRQHRHADLRVLVLHEQAERPEVRRRPEEDDREEVERGSVQAAVTAAQPTSGGTAPAAPPITMFCGVERFSHIV